jgi:hypothetical protein
LSSSSDTTSQNLKIGFLENWGIRSIFAYLNRNLERNKSIEAQKFDKKRFYAPMKSNIIKSVFYSILVGFFTTVAIVGIDSILPSDPELMSEAFLIKWTVSLLSLSFFTFLEFYLLYHIGFYYLVKIAIYAGFQLDDDPLLVTKNKNLLARLVLEIPDHRMKLLNIDPFRLANKHGLLFRTIFYKIKVMLSNFIAKLIFRKLLARTSVRMYADFIIAPITGIWDGIVTYLIFNEVKKRLLTRILTEELLDSILKKSNSIPDSWKDMSVRAIANVVVLNHKFHPNLEYLLLKLHNQFNSSIHHEIVLDDWEYFINTLASMENNGQNFICIIFNFCCGMDGGFSRLERKVVAESKVLSEVNNLNKIHSIVNFVKQGNLFEVSQLISMDDLAISKTNLDWN